MLKQSVSNVQTSVKPVAMNAPSIRWIIVRNAQQPVNVAQPSVVEWQPPDSRTGMSDALLVDGLHKQSVFHL